MTKSLPELTNPGIDTRRTHSAAPLATRLNITVTTDHEEADIQELVAQVLEKDTFFLALRDAQAVTAEIVLDRS